MNYECETLATGSISFVFRCLLFCELNYRDDFRDVSRCISKLAPIIQARSHKACGARLIKSQDGHQFLLRVSIHNCGLFAFIDVRSFAFVQYLDSSLTPGIRGEGWSGGWGQFLISNVDPVVSAVDLAHSGEIVKPSEGVHLQKYTYPPENLTTRFNPPGSTSVQGMDRKRSPLL